MIRLLKILNEKNSYWGVKMTTFKIFIFLSTIGVIVLSLSGGNPFSQEVDKTKIIPELKNRMYAVQIKDNYAYAAVTAGLIVFDISDPSKAKEAAMAYIPGASVSVTLSGDHAFLCAGPSGVWIFDISDPHSPAQAGFFDTRGAAMGCAVKGKTCFIADGTFGLVVLDVSDPQKPREIFHYDIEDTGDYYRHVTADGEYVYAAVGFNGVKIFKTGTNKTSKISEFRTAGEARHVVLSGKELFVADGQGGLRIYDVSDPASPKEKGSISTRDFSRGVAVLGTYAYLADGNGGLRVIDISEPSNPVEKGSAEVPASANGVAVSGNRAFLAADSRGFTVYDVADPSAPFQVKEKEE